MKFDFYKQKVKLVKTKITLIYSISKFPTKKQISNKNYS